LGAPRTGSASGGRVAGRRRVVAGHLKSVDAHCWSCYRLPEQSLVAQRRRAHTSRALPGQRRTAALTIWWRTGHAVRRKCAGRQARFRTVAMVPMPRPLDVADQDSNAFPSTWSTGSCVDAARLVTLSMRNAGPLPLCGQRRAARACVRTPTASAALDVTDSARSLIAPDIPGYGESDPWGDGALVGGLHGRTG
jgi:hypothetical protein